MNVRNNNTFTNLWKSQKRDNLQRKSSKRVTRIAVSWASAKERLILGKCMIRRRRGTATLVEVYS